VPDGGFKTGLPIGALVVAVVGLGIALLLALDDDDDRPTSKTVIVKTEADAQEPSSSSSSPSSTTTTPEQNAEPVAFTSPSGNLVCLMTTTSVRCAASEFEYAPPPQPSSCSIPGWGHVIGVDTSGAGEFICADNAPADPNSPALPYGEGTLVGPFACLSMEAGIRCANRDTRHGFQIAREQVQIF
jgi:hypothetical protein